MTLSTHTRHRWNGIHLMRGGPVPARCTQCDKNFFRILTDLFPDVSYVNAEEFLFGENPNYRHMAFVVEHITCHSEES